MPNREAKKWQHHAENKMLRQVRKQIQHNHEPDKVRQKDWNDYKYTDIETYDNAELPNSERVMPRGEKARRAIVLDKAIKALSEPSNDAGLTEAVPTKQGRRGVVMQVSSGQCRVDFNGDIKVCSLLASLSVSDTGLTNVVAVGDDVVVAGGVVVEVLPRRHVLGRSATGQGHLSQVIAANVEQLLIVSAWKQPAIWLELIDRYLIAAQRTGLEPCLCLNKLDLAEDEADCLDTMQPYRNLGYRVILASAHRGNGIEEVRELMRGHVTVIAGMSGVGKSSLLNAIQPGLSIVTSEVSDHDHLGRHTTTQVTMHRLNMGGYVVDTPGIRQFGLSGMKRSDVASYYPEVLAFAGRCRFANCLHVHEPDCAVRAAAIQQQLPTSRYQTYLKIVASLPE